MRRNMHSVTRLRKSKYIVISVVLLVALALLYHSAPQDANYFQHQIIDYSAGNSTLGFEDILAVAPADPPKRLAWRSKGLLQAAKRTGLDITIPRIPIPSEEELQTLQKEDERRIVQTAVALSWVGHMTAIREATKRESTLILEDDVDWDLEIRSNMPNIASAIRDVSEYKHDENSTEHWLPYGNNWDLLWLGHCGENIDWGRPTRTISDSIVPPYVNSWEKQIAPDPQHQRFIHLSVGPICSFAYALSKLGAEKVLAAEDKGAQNFDVWLHNLCKGQKLRCYSVNPELFHHHEPAGVLDSMINGPSETEVVEHARTLNIWHSARCNLNNFEADTLVDCMGDDEREKPLPD